MNNAIKIFLCVILTSLSLSAMAGEGVMIKSKTKDLRNNGISDSDIYISDSKVLLKNPGTGGGTILFDASTEVFTYIDDKRKEYYQFDKATLTQLKEQVRMFAQMMKQFSSQMPEAQKQKLDMLLNPGSGSSIEYKSISGGEKIKSWNTNKYEGYSDGSKILDLNLASYETLGIDAAKFSVLKKMLTFAKENLQEIASLLPAGGALSQFSFDKESPILRDGIPVKTKTYKNGVAKNENVVESVVLMSIPNSQFSIPQGYVRKKIDIQNQLGK
ncbi:MAG: hypothetical protein JXR07_16085 [Reichenbachiella sp.]